MKLTGEEFTLIIDVLRTSLSHPPFTTFSFSREDRRIILQKLCNFNNSLKINLEFEGENSERS